MIAVLQPLNDSILFVYELSVNWRWWTVCECA